VSVARVLLVACWVLHRYRELPHTPCITLVEVWVIAARGEIQSEGRVCGEIREVASYQSPPAARQRKALRGGFNALRFALASIESQHCSAAS
jgi:hypothetical protein